MSSKVERFLCATFKHDDDTMSVQEKADLFDSMTEKEQETTKKVMEEVIKKRMLQLLKGYMEKRSDEMGITGTSLDPFRPVSVKDRVNTSSSSDE